MNLSYEKQDLANSYNEFALSEELKRFYSNTLNMPLNFAKMMIFANESKLNNESIDYWMFFKPQRHEDESFSDYKNRQKLQKALLKYRKYIYNYNQN
jgi:hypothetical protein